MAFPEGLEECSFPTFKLSCNITEEVGNFLSGPSDLTSGLRVVLIYPTSLSCKGYCAFYDVTTLDNQFPPSWNLLRETKWHMSTLFLFLWAWHFSQFSTRMQQKKTNWHTGKIISEQEEVCNISKYSTIKNVKETGLIAACILPRAETRQTSPRLTWRLNTTLSRIYIALRARTWEEIIIKMG